jgi:ribosomal-protein-alanine N-acetyltransferase
VVCLISVRPFDLDDTGDVLDMEKDVFDEPSPILYSMIERYPSEGFLVAEYDGVVCGYLIGTVFMDEARILLVGVKDGYRRKKVGTKLIEAFIASIRDRTFMVRLEVRVSNLAAQTFYFKMGFRFVGMIGRYYKNGENAYIMFKPMEQVTLFL